ncbi:MAG TPA: universal stress protein [Anaerolineales bacterium]
MFRRMLVPVDGSPHSKRAVEAAVGLAKRLEASVYLLHVIRNLSLPIEIMEMIAAGEITESRMEILQNSAQIILDNARRSFEAAGLTEITSDYVIGDPAYKILEYAEENGVDLIVIGHRGLGPHSGLLGGVSRNLLNMTTISCLVVA